MTELPVAAVDLGSNSFHMVVARLVGDRLHVMDRIRERVALAEGLDDRGKLTKEAQQAALDCLARFGERVQNMPKGRVRAVGTNTLRRARNARSFLNRAREALGHPIEVVAGSEEARLVYLGVAHSVAHHPGRRLVVDIGGGSTECVIGCGFEVESAHSLYMGCVGFSQRFFRKGRVTPDAWEDAVLAARVEMAHIETPFQSLGWESCVGSSGTILSIHQILTRQGWTEDAITREGLSRLRDAMFEARKVKHLDLAGLTADRRNVLPGGAAILTALFEGLGIEAMEPSSGALREGLLYDLLGRLSHEDIRDRTIRELVDRYHVDAPQAQRVEHTALDLLEQVAESWDLPIQESRQYLAWAARLHEIGLSVSFSHYHHHSAYLVAHGNLPGFTRENQQLLAALIGCHRRKLQSEVWLEPQTPFFIRLLALLRISVLLNRTRSPQGCVDIEARAAGSRLKLHFPSGWLEEHPLARADLEQEAARWAPLEHTLVISSQEPSS